MKVAGALAIHSFMELAHGVSGDRNLSAVNSPDGSALVCQLGFHLRLTWPSRWQEVTAVTLRNGLLSPQLLSAPSTSRELQPFPAWHSQRASPSPALWKYCPLSSKQDYLLLVWKCPHSKLESLQGGLSDSACVATVCEHACLLHVQCLTSCPHTQPGCLTDVYQVGQRVRDNTTGETSIPLSKNQNAKNSKMKKKKTS